MKLGIISDCVHFYTPDGRIATENHIFVRQMEALAAHFSEVLICCPFASYSESVVSTVYSLHHIHFVAMSNVGENTIKEKLRLLSAMPRWFKAFRQVDKFSDIVYQRFPNNLNIPGFFFFYFKKKKVFATYTGTWNGYKDEPATYRLQRWLLRNYFKGPVWAYTDKPLQNNIHRGFSPSYSMAEWQQETAQVEERINRLNHQPLQQLRMITVGTLIGYKNQLYILKASLLLKQQGIPFKLSVVGDGPIRQELAAFISQNNLANEVTLCGKKNYEQLRELYRQHDFVVQAPLSEGFGKVPVEGFFHGLVPVINNIAMAAYMTGNGERGFMFEATDPANLANLLRHILQHSEQLPPLIENGRQFARSQTLEAWADDYFMTIQQYFG